MARAPFLRAVRLSHGVNVLTGQALGPTLARLGFAAVLGEVFYLLRRTSGLLVTPMLVDGPVDVASLVSAPRGERRVASSGAGAVSAGADRQAGTGLHPAGPAIRVGSERHRRSPARTGRPLSQGFGAPIRLDRLESNARGDRRAPPRRETGQRPQGVHSNCSRRKQASRSMPKRLALRTSNDSFSGSELALASMGIQHSGGNGARVSVVVQGGSR